MSRESQVRRVLVLLAVLAAPLAAVAQAAPPGPPAAPPGPASSPPGPPPGPPGDGRGPPAEMRERMEKRMRLARALGLAEAMDLDEAGAAKLNAELAPFDARRKAILEGVRADVVTLRRAARKGDPAALAGVDGAVKSLLDARGAMVSLDREMIATLSKGRTPQQVARMALFLARFRQRFGMEMHDAEQHGWR